MFIKRKGDTRLLTHAERAQRPLLETELFQHHGQRTICLSQVYLVQSLHCCFYYIHVFIYVLLSLYLLVISLCRTIFMSDVLSIKNTRFHQYGFTISAPMKTAF